MKKVLTLLVALTIAVAVSGMAFAGEKKAAEPAAKAEAKNPCAAKNPCGMKNPCAAKAVTKGEGEVTAIDAKAKTVTVKTKKGEVIISISDASNITVGKEAKDIKDVKVGDKIKVTVIKPAKKEEKK
ncbi:MAG: hypothetical protein HZB54_01285 [Deltaproteobacteria bacterium]|nr:hypothetical protein [Deltaproteobacteria bacterium]